MYVKDLLDILEDCDPEDEVTFIFDEDKKLSWDMGENMKQVTQINVCGKKIDGKIALTNGFCAVLLDGSEESIFKK